MPDPSDPASAPRRASRTETVALGMGLVLFALLWAYALLSFWPPAGLPASPAGQLQKVTWLWTAQSFEVTADVRVLLVVLAAGGLGSFVHTATSFADFVGNERLTSSWIWWYVMKPFIGMALALVFHAAFRGGFLSGDVDPSKLNVYGVAALAALAGMFSKQATDKLSEVFTTMFRTQPGGGDAKRQDGLNHAAPVLGGAVPAALAVGATALTLRVTGSGLVAGTVVHVNGAERPTTLESDGTLRVTLKPEDVAQAGTLKLEAHAPAPGGGVSAPLLVAVGGVAPDVPAPEHEHADGCGGAIDTVTPDEALPAATGGVSKP